MVEKPSFLFVGGDLRSLYAAKKLNQLYKVSAYGFKDIAVQTGVDILEEKPQEKYDYIVLPLPASFDDKHINAPYFNEKIPYDIISDVMDENTVVFVGRKWSALEMLISDKKAELIDYFQREELVVMNALITAEGAVQIAMENSGKTLFSSEVLISGYGRITKSLVRIMSSMGAKITVIARNYADLAWAEIMGTTACHISKIDDKLHQFDFIINTVPAVIFNEDMLSKVSSDCLFIDLASKSGIEDLELARKLGVNAIWALSLPYHDY